MKQTLTVNLNGLVFHIDQDAYNTLNTYLEAVRKQIGSSEEEIMADVEARIAELLTDMLRHKGSQVVNNFMVGQVMEQLGRPEDFSTDDEQATEESLQTANNEKMRHRLYRDVDTSILGGVCSGIAAYLGWDVVWVRLLFVLCTFFWGVTIPIYLLIWLIAPAAETAAQRLEMRGEVASIENIKKEYAQVTQCAEEHQVAKRTRRVLMVILKIVIFAVLACLMIPLLGLVVAFVAVCFAMLTAMLALPFGLRDTAADVVPVLFGHTWCAVLAAVFLLLVLGIPLFVGIYWIVKYIKTHQHPSAKFWIISLVLWLCSSIGLGATAVYAGRHWSDVSLTEIDEPDMIVCDKSVPVQPFTKIHIQGAVCLQVAQADTFSVCLQEEAVTPIYTNFEDGTLVVRVAEAQGDAPRLRVTLPQLESCYVEGAAQISTDGKVTSDHIRFVVEGAAAINAELDVEALSVAMDGAAVCQFKGAAKHFDLSQEGMSVVNATELVADTVNVSCEGMSVAKVMCRKRLRAEADGTSRISYSGNPTECKVSEEGMASVKPM